MDLACSLSPLVFAEFYGLLSEQHAWSEVIAERLNELGLPEDWLGQATQQYEHGWQEIVDYHDRERRGLGERHAVLATMILSAARRRGDPSARDGHTGDCSRFATELAQRVAERYYETFPDAEGPVPAQYQPAVVAWVVGSVVGTLDSTVPVVPALLPDDVNIRDAYRGLIEHAVVLGYYDDQFGEPWPELMCSALTIRGVGLVEAMYPDIDGQGKSINSAMADAAAFLSTSRHRELGRHWAPGRPNNEFVDKRDVLAHVRNLNDRITLQDAIAHARLREAIQETLAGAAQFICQLAQQELTEGETLPLTCDRTTLKHMRAELGIYE